MKRRTLLLVGCGGLLKACGPPFPTLAAEIPAGNESDLSAGTLRAIAGQGVAIGRDSGGIYALSTVCTHAGCDMSFEGSVGSGGLDCSCHGSRFDAQGNVLRGPAGDPLPHLTVTTDASGNLTIHGDQPAPASARLAVS